MRSADSSCAPDAEVAVLMCFLLTDLVHKEPKRAVFLNHLLRLTNDMHKIGPEKHFIVVVAKCYTVSRKIPKNMALGYDKHSRMMLIQVYSPLLTDIL